MQHGGRLHPVQVVRVLVCGHGELDRPRHGGELDVVQLGGHCCLGAPSDSSQRQVLPLRSREQLIRRDADRRRRLQQPHRPVHGRHRQAARHRRLLGRDGRHRPDGLHRRRRASVSLLWKKRSRLREAELGHDLVFGGGSSAPPSTRNRSGPLRPVAAFPLSTKRGRGS
jgi:hypothetical protein